MIKRQGYYRSVIRVELSAGIARAMSVEIGNNLDYKNSQYRIQINVFKYATKKLN